MNLIRLTLSTILLVAFGTIRSYGQITLSDEAFDTYARFAVERNAFRDSLQLSKEDFRECEGDVKLLQDSVSAAKAALKTTNGKLEDKKKWNVRFKKIIAWIGAVAILEGVIIYVVVR